MESVQFDKYWLFEYCPCRTASCRSSQPEREEYQKSEGESRDV